MSSTHLPSLAAVCCVVFLETKRSSKQRRSSQRNLKTLHDQGGKICEESSNEEQLLAKAGKRVLHTKQAKSSTVAPRDDGRLFFLGRLGV
jgi:hypothetical protein